MEQLKKLRTAILSSITVGLLVFMPTHFAFAFEILGNGSDIPDIIISGIIKIFLTLLIIKIALLALLWCAGWFLNTSFDLFVTGSHDWFSLDAIHSTWDLVLNISNTVFIFVLLYIGVAIILFGISQYKKPLVSLLITALLVNFSLFFTRIVIDTSNIVGSALYNKTIVETGGRYIGTFIVLQSQVTALTPENSETEMHTAPTEGPNPTTDSQMTSEMGKFLNAFSSNIASAKLSTDPLGWVLNKLVGWISGIFAFIADSILIYLLNYIFYALVIYVLLFLSFMIIGRYIVLIFIMIVSPLAFASYALPKTKAYVWDPWFKELMGQAMVLPALTFFLLFTVKIMSDPSVNGLPIIIRYAIFVSLLLGTIKIANILSSAVAKYAGKAAGVSTKAIGAGSAISLAAVGGATGKRLAKSEWASQHIDDKGWRGLAARSTMWTGNKMHAGTWDIRNAPGGNLLGGGTGIKSSFKSVEESFAKSRAGLSQQGYDNVKGKIGEAKRAKELIELEAKERKEKLKEEHERLDKDTTLDPEERNRRKAKAQKDYDDKEAVFKKDNEPKLKELNATIEKYDKMSEGMFKNLEKSSKQTSKFSLPGTEKGISDAYKAIKNKRTVEAAKEARETKQAEKFAQTEAFSKVIKEYSKENAAALKDAMSNTSVEIVAQVLARPENQEKLHDKDFTAGIDGKMADRILKNKEFQGSASRKTQDVMEGIRDKDRIMQPTKTTTVKASGNRIGGT